MGSIISTALALLSIHAQISLAINEPKTIQQLSNHTAFDLFKNTGVTFCADGRYPPNATTYTLHPTDKPVMASFNQSLKATNQDAFCDLFKSPPVILPTIPLPPAYIASWTATIISFGSLLASLGAVLYSVGRLGSHKDEPAKVSASVVGLAIFDFARCVYWWMLLVRGAINLPTADYLSTILWVVPGYYWFLFGVYLEALKERKATPPWALIWARWFAAILCFLMFLGTLGIIIISYNNMANIHTRPYTPIDLPYFLTEYKRVCGVTLHPDDLDPIFFSMKDVNFGFIMLRTAAFGVAIVVLSTTNFQALLNVVRSTEGERPETVFEAKLMGIKYLYLVVLWSTLCMPVLAYIIILAKYAKTVLKGIPMDVNVLNVEGCPPLAFVFLNLRWGYLDVEYGVVWRVLKAVFAAGSS